MGENREKDGDDQGGPGSEAGPDPADDGDYDDESEPGHCEVSGGYSGSQERPEGATIESISWREISSGESGRVYSGFFADYFGEGETLLVSTHWAWTFHDAFCAVQNGTMVEGLSGT